jgi:hypothetical protein
MTGNSDNKFGDKVNVPDDVVRSANEFLQRVLGPIANVSDLLSDKIRFIRYRSAIKTLAAAKEIADKSHIRLTEVSTKFLVPFLEASSLEEEDGELIKKWAALLVSAAEDRNSSFNWCIRILGEIDGRHAKLLESIYDHSRTDRHSDMYTRTLAEREFTQETESLDSNGRDLERVVESWEGYCYLLCEDDIPNTNELHLLGFDDGDVLLQQESLGLVWVFSSWVVCNAKRYYIIRAFISPLGCAFVEACSEKDDQ